jgi:excisionase family DNA binding protein
MVQVGALYTSLKALLMAEIDRIATLRTVEREFGHNLSRGGGGRNSTAKGNDVIEIDESERRTLSQLRDRIEGAIKVGIVTNGVKGEVKTVWLSAGVIEKLAIVLRCMAGPEAVRIRPLNNELTTQEAAEFLGISRPSMVKLLRENALPWSTPTLKKTHRRVKLSDLVAFRDSLADEAAERGEPKLLAGRAAFLAEAEAARTRRQITPR